MVSHFKIAALHSHFVLSRGSMGWLGWLDSSAGLPWGLSCQCGWNWGLVSSGRSTGMLAKVPEHLLSNSGHRVSPTRQNKGGKEEASCEYPHLMF